MNEKSKASLVGAIISLIGGFIVAIVGGLSGYWVQESKEDSEKWHYYMNNMTELNSIEGVFRQLSVLVYLNYHHDALPDLNPQWVQNQFCNMYFGLDSRLSIAAESISQSTPVEVLRGDRDVKGCRNDPTACVQGYDIIKQSDMLENLYGCYQVKFCPTLKVRGGDYGTKFLKRCQDLGIADH